MNVKRIARYLKDVPIAKCVTEINVYTSRTPSNVQEHKWWSHAVAKHDSFCLVKNTTVSEHEFSLSRIICPDNWTF